MKYLAVVAVVSLITGGCHTDPNDNVGPSPSEIQAAHAEVADVVERFGRMWEDEDMRTFDQIVAHDDDLVVIGTDAAERIIGFEAYRESRRRQYESFENIEFDVLKRDIKLSHDGRAAWFAEEFNLFLLAQGEPISLDGLRVTGGLEKRDSVWVIVQLHYSVPVAGQAAEY